MVAEALVAFFEACGGGGSRCRHEAGVGGGGGGDGFREVDVEGHCVVIVSP